MKELSIEEKAKRYDEAIEQLRAMMPNWENLSYNCKTFLQDLVYIIPELKESEDERIRKAIVSFIDEMKGDFDSYEDIKLDDMVAWLEKQGEQKPAEKFPKYKKGDILTDGKNKYEVLSWDYTETGIAAYYMKGAGCKFSFICEAADKELYIVEQTPQRIVSAEAKEAMYDKPAWSEEDETMVNSIISFCDFKVNIEHNEGVKEASKKVLSWLNELKGRVQPKQEWSEEDDEKINELCSFVYENYRAEEASDRISWLKSLKDRYTWKPSNEQMNALVQASVTGVPGHKEALESLINDLKKLREE